MIARLEIGMSDEVVDLDDMDLEHIHAGASAKGAAGKACGVLRDGAALCDSLGLSDKQKVSKKKKK